MIPAKIHQIYFNLLGKELNEIELFQKSHECCKSQDGFEYKLWTEQECDELIKNDFPKYYDFYHNFRFPIQKIDFVRFAILRKFGGIYIDLDMFIIKSLKPMLKQKLVLHNIQHIKPKFSFIENDFMASEPIELWDKVMQYCVLNYNEFKTRNIYDIWKGRFILHTTGPYFMNRFVKKFIPKYKPKKIVMTKWDTEESPIFYIRDHKANTWIDNDTWVKNKTWEKKNKK